MGVRKRLRINNFFSGINSVFDESVLPMSTAKEIYNFDFSSGALTEGYGTQISSLASLSNIKSAWVFKRSTAPFEVVMMQTEDGKIYYIDDGVHQLEGITVLGKAGGINYRLYDEDVIIICSNESSMVVWDYHNMPYTVANSPKIVSMVMHNERMFAAQTDGETLRFSDDLDPTNWAESLVEGGYIKLIDDRGRIGKVVSFLSYLYAFREYGISRLSGYGDQTEFSISNLFTSSGRIFFDSVALCGDRVMFLASDGIYQFDGLSTKKVLSVLDGLIEFSPSAKGIYHNGNYYLACRLSGNRGIGCENDEYVNNGLICVDLSSGNYTVTRGVDINGFISTESKLLCISNSVLGEVVPIAQHLGQTLPKKWCSPFSDLGSEKPKLLKEFCIFSEGDIRVSVESDMGEITFLVKGSRSISRTVLNLRGTRFKFQIEADGNSPLIQRPTLIILEG